MALYRLIAVESAPVLVARVAGKYFGDFLRESPSKSAALTSAWIM